MLYFVDIFSLNVWRIVEFVVSLQCVFHSIRFKVNISGLSGVPFFLPFFLDYSFIICIFVA
jgi:hypothetical protein